jgi:hypothetical protein
MEFQAQPGRPFQLRLIPPLLADLLKEIPNWTTEFSQNADERLYPLPTDDLLERELIKDWSAYIQPGLAEHFQSCRATVASDLAKMTQEKSGVFQLTIPFSHADAWINALTQARLAIATELGFTEEELSEKNEPELTNKRDFAAFQVNFYGFLTHYFVEHLGE